MKNWQGVAGRKGKILVFKQEFDKINCTLIIFELLTLPTSYSPKRGYFFKKFKSPKTWREFFHTIFIRYLTSASRGGEEGEKREMRERRVRAKGGSERKQGQTVIHCDTYFMLAVQLPEILQIFAFF